MVTVRNLEIITDKFKAV